MLKTLDFRGYYIFGQNMTKPYPWSTFKYHGSCILATTCSFLQPSNHFEKVVKPQPPQIMELLEKLWEQDYIVYLSGRPPLAWGSTIGNDSSHTWHSALLRPKSRNPRCWSAENGSVHNEGRLRGQRPTHVPTRDEVNKIFACWNHHPNGSQHGGYLKLIQNCYQFIWKLMTNFAGFPMVSDQFQVPNPNGVAQARHCS